MVRTNKLLVCGLLLASLAGCNFLAALSSGKGTVKAEVKIPPKSKVLVFVDPRAQTQLTPERETQLAEAIMDHLWKYKAADSFVGQQQITLLKAQHAELNDFSKLGIANVAQETGADVVIHVDVIDYMTPQMSEGQITIGYATVLIKVVDKNGKRIYPDITDTLGRQIDAHVDFQLNDPGTPSTIDQKLSALLALRVGRMFHDYDGDDRALAK